MHLSTFTNISAANAYNNEDTYGDDIPSPLCGEDIPHDGLDFWLDILQQRLIIVSSN